MDKVREVMEMSGVREGDIKQKRVSFISVCLHHFTIDQRLGNIEQKASSQSSLHLANAVKAMGPSDHASKVVEPFWVRRTRWSFYLGALAPKAPKKSAPMPLT